MNKFKERILNLDVLRIFAGVAVVAIHVSDAFVNYTTIFGGLSWWIANIINSFARISVPLFIVISGSLLIYRYDEYGLRGFIKKRFSRILIPFFFWTIFYFWWNNFWFHVPVNLKTIVFAYTTVGLSHLYFLVIMMGLYLICPVLGVFSAYASPIYKKYFFFGAFIFSFLLILLNRLIPFGAYVPNIFTTFFAYICFFYAGDYLRKKQLDKKQILQSGTVIIILAALNPLLNFITVKMDISHISVLWAKGVNQYFFEPFSPFIILMTLLLFVVFMSLNFEKLLGSRNHIRHGIINISSTVFGIYLIHPLVMHLLDDYAGLRIDKLVSPLWIFMLFKILLVFAISYVVVGIGKKIPVLKTVFG